MTPELLIPFVQSLPGCKISPGLYLVATPIGHLSDISLRALAVLSQADLIACEDTRVTSKLLNLYNIKKPLLSYHEHNAKITCPKIISYIQAGQSVAIVSDAGTPLISDPGFNLVSECINHNLNITSIPGPNAAITALTLSGLPCDRFVFIGFLPSKTTARQKELTHYQSYKETLIIYEAPHRINDLLKDIETIFKDRDVTVARELTKKFEEVSRGTASDILETFKNHVPKGEFVILIHGAQHSEFPRVSDEDILSILKSFTPKTAAEMLSETYGISKKDIYQRIIQLKK